MADLNVQPKKKSILPWLLLILGIIALLFFLLRGCNRKDDTATVVTADSVRTTNPATDSASTVAAGDWNDVDFNAPAANYSEITDTNINVRSSANYGIYGIGENVLFDEGKSTIRSNAEQNLREVAASIKQRYNGASVRVYGYTDAKGSAGNNKELAEQRAQAVSKWLSENGGISSSNISLHPVGEGNPVASNATESGRQQNRRVEIVARGVAQGNK